MNSADIALLYRVSELARRFGLRPSEAEAEFGWVKDGPEDNSGTFRLVFASRPGVPEKDEKFDRLKAALGCKNGILETDDMHQIEDIVEKAFSLAPRSRSL